MTEYEKIFEKIIDSKLFIKYEDKMNLDDWNEMLNDITYFIIKNYK